MKFYFLMMYAMAGSINRTPSTISTGYIALRAFSGVLTAVWRRDTVFGSSMVSRPS